MVRKLSKIPDIMTLLLSCYPTSRKKKSFSCALAEHYIHLKPDMKWDNLKVRANSDMNTRREYTGWGLFECRMAHMQGKYAHHVKSGPVVPGLYTWGRAGGSRASTTWRSALAMPASGQDWLL